MKEIKSAILAGVFFGILCGTFLAFRTSINYALIAGPISGLFFGVTIYFFATSKIVKQQTQIEVPDGISILYSDGANHFKNGEGVGGKLYLLTDRLQFQSHNFNIQNHGLTIDIGQIKDVSLCNIFGLVPTGLAITTLDGKKEKFVVGSRKVWKKEIEKLMRITT